MGMDREGLRRADIFDRPGIVKFLRQLHLIVRYEEIIYIISVHDVKH